MRHKAAKPKHGAKPPRALTVFYMTHYALVLLVFARLIGDRRQPEQALLMAPLMTLFAIAFAFVSGRYVDRPIRATLSGRRADRGRAPGEN
jgi:peptidoglycan/LPS O-acetylase OafA/YrhL